jgi:hypothetical protein
MRRWEQPVAAEALIEAISELLHARRAKRNARPRPVFRVRTITALRRLRPAWIVNEQKHGGQGSPT